MDERVFPAALTILAFLVIVLLMWLGWRRRARMQSDLASPLPAPQTSIEQPIGEWDEVHYVSTSRTGDALDRIVVAPLGYRGRAKITVLREGAVVHIAGERPFLIPAPDIESSVDGTVTIDRVVENGGLTIIRWLLPAGTSGVRTSVETSLRVVDANTRAELKNALHELQLKTPAPTTEESS